ncbi:hypothetical protein TVAG_222800 [Trichomonas vaginalis G3]|uniref:VHS domain-containing protein n=1 Tax=Trichomonas vaginalis (strain ATCC PRA-98 / G3) TaxID=412133 RepID=A2FHX5_TRIV3|nr:UV-stimulated scaffold protein A family [Trichomonas vaginalis G3]EAX95484.1 hypothetical protein TVAG_222800 [Trichomonas vaginalis G3]KAI5531083.1 UV-stimulated scaffold protein A family [Trichomonas vaginalis G3]|eukprot:XP_001308414.1 hypothetical protein [Trichomonas vaginalis G3]
MTEKVDVWRMIRMLTSDKGDVEVLNEKNLKKLVQQLRSDNSQYQSFYQFLDKRAESSSSQTRYLTLQLTNYFFIRSAHFRHEVCNSYLFGFLQKFYDKLPSPKKFAEKIEHYFPIIIQIWSEDYKHIYPQLSYLPQQFPSNKSVKMTRQERINLTNAKLLSQNFKKEYEPFLNKIENLIKLLSPPDADQFPPSDEYFSLVKENLMIERKPMERCLADLSWVTTITKRAAGDTDIHTQMSELYKRAQTLSDSMTGYNDDEFEEVETI